MCKTTEYRFTKCGHKHVKQDLCRGTRTKVDHKGRTVALCAGARISKNGRLKGKTFTLPLAGRCPPCEKRVFLRAEGLRVNKFADEHKGEEGREAVRGFWALKERLDCETPIRAPRVEGAFDNEAKGKPKWSPLAMGRRHPLATVQTLTEEGEEDVLCAGAVLCEAIDEKEDEDDDPPRKWKRVSRTIKQCPAAVEEDEDDDPPRSGMRLTLRARPRPAEREEA